MVNMSDNGNIADSGRTGRHNAGMRVL
jgi:hypothetical protein